MPNALLKERKTNATLEFSARNFKQEEIWDVFIFCVKTMHQTVAIRLEST
jgi:hypothetical protein